MARRLLLKGVVGLKNRNVVKKKIKIDTVNTFLPKRCPMTFLNRVNFTQVFVHSLSLK